jgi:hypothetical protein
LSTARLPAPQLELSQSLPYETKADHALCTVSPASTWIRIPVILVFCASITNASAQSCKYVSCFSTAASLICWMRSGEYLLPYHHTGRQSPFLEKKDRIKHTHSVNNNPGSTVFTRIFGPTFTAIHLTSCHCAALVTAYGMLDPPWLIAYRSSAMPSRALLPEGKHTATEPVVIICPPSGFASNVARASLSSALGTLTFAAQHCHC